MKRLLFITLLTIMMIPAMAQISVYVSGTVTDLSNGNPIPNHSVTIMSDSSFGFFYYTTVYTDASGVYSDTMYSPVNYGLLYVQTYDCNQLLHQDTCNYAQGNTTFVKNFSICDSVGIQCNAEFTYFFPGGGSNHVQFQDMSTNPNNIWSWNFGDGSVSNLQHPDHIFPGPGTYTVGLTIGDPATCSDYISYPVVIVDSTGGGCQAYYYSYPDSSNFLTHYFMDLSSGNITSWTWNFGDPGSGSTNISTQQNPVHTFTTAGTYYVCLTIQGADSTCYDTYCDTVLVGNNTGCQAQFTYYTDPAQGANTVTFLDLSSGTPVSWYWDFGDSTYSTAQNPVHTYAQPGNYYVCLTIQCSGTVSVWCQVVTVGNGIDCSSYFTFQKNNLQVAFTGIMVNQQPASFAWDFGDGQTGTGQTIGHTYAANGMYYVTLTTTTSDSMNCTYSSSQTIMVGDSSQFNQIYGQVFAGNFPISSGMVMIFSLDTNQNYSPYTEVCMVDSMGVYYFPTVPLGNYYVYAIPFEPYGYLPTYYGDVLYWETATLIQLGQANNPYDIHLVTGDTLVAGPGSIGGQISISGLKSWMMDKITMQLMNEEGKMIAYDQVDDEGAFTFPSLGYGTYLVHAEIAGVTSDVVTVNITAEEPSAMVNLTFSGNRILGIGDKPVSATAGNLFPNPVTDRASIYVTAQAPTTATVEVFNMAGQCVVRLSRELAAGSNLLTVPATSIGKGIYTLRILSGDGMNVTRKLIKSE